MVGRPVEGGRRRLRSVESHHHPADRLRRGMRHADSSPPGRPTRHRVPAPREGCPGHPGQLVPSWIDRQCVGPPDAGPRAPGPARRSWSRPPRAGSPRRCRRGPRPACACWRVRGPRPTVARLANPWPLSVISIRHRCPMIDRRTRARVAPAWRPMLVSASRRVGSSWSATGSLTAVSTGPLNSTGTSKPTTGRSSSARAATRARMPRPPPARRARRWWPGPGGWSRRCRPRPRTGVGHVPAGRARRQALERQPDGEEPLDDPVVEVPGHAVPVLVHGDVAGPLVQPGVLDGDAGGQGQGLDDRLVVGGELVGPDLVGQVQVAVDPVLDPDRGPEERGHGRVAGREPGARRVVAEHGDADGAGVLDQHAQDALAGGQRTLEQARLDVDGQSRRQEVDRGRPLLVEHAQCPVAGVGQRPGLADDVGEEVGEVEVGLQEQRGLEDPAERHRILERVEGRSFARRIVRHRGQG